MTPEKMPETIWIGIDGRWYRTLRPFDAEYRGHEYTRSDHHSAELEKVRDALVAAKRNPVAINTVSMIEEAISILDKISKGG